MLHGIAEISSGRVVRIPLPMLLMKPFLVCLARSVRFLNDISLISCCGLVTAAELESAISSALRLRGNSPGQTCDLLYRQLTRYSYAPLRTHLLSWRLC